MTGIMDHPILANHGLFWNKSSLGSILTDLKHETISVNKEWATKLNINPSTSITTVKPSGTVSQLVDSASGIHPRHSAYYIRTVRADVKDPLAVFLQAEGVPCEQDVVNKNNLVFSFPIKAPEGSITRHDVKAINQLEHYLVFQQNWCEHNPSITVYVKNDEWLDVGAWVYRNLDKLGGVSFLPHSDHLYQQAPYQDLSQEQYEVAVSKFPKIDWDKFNAFEVDDATMNMHELACVSGVCEVL